MSIEVVGRKIAVIIAVENFSSDHSTQIPSIEYAGNSAKSFENMLIENLGFQKENVHCFINEDADLETIENELPHIIESLTTSDTFFFYYAGHAYSTRGENLFTLFDSNQDSLKATSAFFEELLLEPLSDNPCKKAFLFIDANATQLLKTKSPRAVIEELNEKEFTDYIDQFDHQACFFSASATQLSYPCSKLRMGIWAWYVIQAISGEADKAFERKGGNIVTFNTLKKYLSRSVPAYITKETKIRGNQEPFAIVGNDSKTVVVEYADDQFDNDDIASVSLNASAFELRRTEVEPYKNFSGYVKGRNSEPKKHCTSAEDWAHRLTIEDIKQEIEDIYKSAKVIFGYKKRECEKDPDGGFLATPQFRYTVSGFQDPDDFRSIKITRVLELRIDMSSIPAGFDTVFPKMFEDLYIPITGSLNFDELTEAFEDLEDNGQGELIDEEGKLTFYPKNSKGVKNIVISEKGIFINFSTANETIQTMLGNTQQTFGIIAAPIQKLLG